VPKSKADLFAFTLDETSGQFSPTTRYQDYAISPTPIHWESQSVTRAESETGLRYQHHEELGSSIIGHGISTSLLRVDATKIQRIPPIPIPHLVTALTQS
jgi:hypothetical protein